MQSLLGSTVWLLFLGLAGALPLSGTLLWYLSGRASASPRSRLRVALEILATVPTVVTFLFVLVLFPVRMTSWAQTSLMALPFVFMEAPRLVLSADRLTATVTGERDAAIALGATTSAALRYVVFPAVRLPLGGLLARTSARLLGGASALVLTLHALATGTADALARVLPAVLILTATCCALGAMAAWCFARSHLNEVTDE